MPMTLTLDINHPKCLGRWNFWYHGFLRFLPMDLSRCFALGLCLPSCETGRKEGGGLPRGGVEVGAEATSYSQDYSVDLESLDTLEHLL